MYQPYPSGGKNMVSPERPPAPPSILKAVKLMYAGAAVSTVSLIVSLVSISSTKSQIYKDRPNLTVSQANHLELFIITLAVVSGLLGIGLWLWMAQKNGQGRNWARILSSVLFILATVDLYGVLSQPKTVIGLVFPVLTWLLGLGAIILLYRKESTAFFRPRQLL
jgi:hypothetical protein